MEPFPDHMPLKGFLRRIVQLAKRHRSVYFEHAPGRAPISIIITTLACRAYAAAVASGTIFETEFDLLCDVISRMPLFIERRWENERIEVWVPNETTNGENFAEKWNKDPDLAKAFFEWHTHAVRDFQTLAETEDAETTFSLLKPVVGSRITASVRNRATGAVNRARLNGALRAAPSGALTYATGIPVASNTFFGS